MILYILIVLALGTFEVIRMKNKGMRKEMIVYIAISIISIAFAVYYYSCDSSRSFSKLVLDLFKIEH